MTQVITRDTLFSILEKYEERIGRLERALSVSKNLVGPFQISSGVIAANTGLQTSFTHNFGSTAYDMVVSEQLDGGWGYFVQWILVNRGANSLTLAWYNDSGIPATMILKFFLRPTG